MSKIIRNQTIVEDDWSRLDDTAPVPATGKFILSLARWQAERAALKPRGQLGVLIDGKLDVAGLQDDLHYLSLIVIPFVFIQPKPEGGRTFDGRGYSQARLLRERLGFKGEIRATGDVFRDAMYYMHRCGINEFEMKPGQDLKDALNAFKDFSTAYQAAADGQPSVFRRRNANVAS